MPRLRRGEPVMSAPGNVFYRAAVALRRALDKYERETDVAQLLAGDPIEVAERWRCSAVKLKDDNWLVVPFSDPVQIDGSKRRIRAFGGGLLSGRAKYFDLHGVGDRCSHLAYMLYIYVGGVAADVSLCPHRLSPRKFLEGRIP